MTSLKIGREREENKEECKSLHNKIDNEDMVGKDRL